MEGNLLYTNVGGYPVSHDHGKSALLDTVGMLMIHNVIPVTKKQRHRELKYQQTNLNEILNKNSIAQKTLKEEHRNK